MTGIVMDRLRAPGGDATPIEVIGTLDDICARCPKRRGDICATQDKIARLDDAHARALALKPGDRRCCRSTTNWYSNYPKPMLRLRAR